jgi:hypothetical protein
MKITVLGQLFGELCRFGGEEVVVRRRLVNSMQAWERKLLRSKPCEPTKKAN